MDKVSDLDIENICKEKDLLFITRFIKNKQTYLTCVCNKHFQPYEFDISYHNLKNMKKSCPKCAGKKLTTDDIIYRVSQLNNNVKIIGKYKNMRTPILTQCKLCGNVWEANVVSLCQGSGCFYCKKNKPRKEHETYIKQLSKVQPNLEIISKYISDSDFITYRCTTDGYIGKAKAGKLLSLQKRCTCCSKRKLHDSQCLTQENFESRLKSINDNIKVIGKYYNSNTKIKLLCLIHNIEYEQLPISALQGKCGCHKCITSKGEKSITNILDKMGISYIQQYKFEGCADKRPLPFDFYLPNYNIVIEYQGEQHYNPVCFYSISKEQSENNLALTQKHDHIKKTYCKNNNIILLEISYWEYDNIESIIREKLCI